MIELSVLLPDLPQGASPKKYTFDQVKIVIGKTGTPDVDIPIEGASVTNAHLIILAPQDKETQHYIIINATNDPFVSINDLPFGKRRLLVGDLITIGETTIRCQAISQSSPSPEALPPEPKIEKPLEEIVSLPVAPIPLQETSLPLKPAELIKIAVTQALRASKTAAEQQDILSGMPKPSLKDDYLREYDDESDTNLFKKRERGINDYALLQSPKSWSLVAKFGASFLGIFMILLGFLYVNVRSENNEEELHAARSITDVAMALTHAQIRHIQPQNNNWSDPEFIKSNLSAILAPEHTSLAEFDPHGQFTKCSYMLRIYTSNDNTHFIVIAQPTPTLFQWLIPRASLVINSDSMVIRRIYDLKAVNRLLVNAPSLDNKESKELVALVEKGELIPLSELINRPESHGFLLPKSLAILHPGAENYIYNAPRYYPLGEHLIDQLITLLDKPTHQHDMLSLQQDFHTLSQFPHFLIYSSKGFEHAMQAQRALTALNTDERFLIGYATINNKGKISTAHLLPDESEQLPPELPEEENIAYNDPKIKLKESPLTSTHPDLLSNRSDPFLLQLTAIITSRSLVLKPLNDELTILVTNHTSNWDPNFDIIYAKTFGKYTKIDEEQKEKIIKSLGTFVQEHRHLPASRFVNYVEEAKGMLYFDSYLEGLKEKVQNSAETKEKLHAQFREITMSMSWQTLNQSVAKTAMLLTFETIPNANELITIQNELSSRVIQKLNQFLLSYDQSLPADAFNSESRDLIMHIMENAWIEDPETHSFYLSEFDQRRTGSYK